MDQGVPWRQFVIAAKARARACTTANRASRSSSSECAAWLVTYPGHFRYSRPVSGENYPRLTALRASSRPVSSEAGRAIQPPEGQEEVVADAQGGRVHWVR